MIIIVGLGNPGENFSKTRHNVGFMVVDFFAKENNFPEFKLSKKYQAEISENENIILAKPQTFMNESGISVASLLKNHQATLIVVQDDIDMELGKIKFIKQGGTGGHKGIASIIEKIGHNDFIRLKVGIATGDEKALDVVLKKFTNEELEKLPLERASQALDYFIKNGLEKTMNEYHN